MNFGSHFALPAGLAIAAALLNASVLHSKLQPVEMVGLTSSLTASSAITQDNIRPVTVHYPSQGLANYFWRWDEAEHLVGKTLAADIPGGLLPRHCFMGVSAEKLSAPQDGILLGLRCPTNSLPDGKTNLRETDVLLETSEHRYGPYRVKSCDVRSESSTITLVVTVMDESIADVESLSTQTVERIIPLTNEF